MTTREEAAEIIRVAADRLGSVAKEVHAGTAGREEVADAIAEARGAVVRAFGPKPRAKHGEGGKWKMLAR